MKDLAAGIDAEWVSTEETTLDGVPAYESAFSVPIVEDDRYTFIARYAVRDDTVYSVMHTVFPPEYESLQRRRGRGSRVVPVPLIHFWPAAEKKMIVW